MSGRFRLGRAALWSATWGVGVAIGVALGGWLTVVGGAGTPGSGALTLGDDVVLLPGLAGLVVFGLHLIGQILIAFIRQRRMPGDGDEHDENAQRAKNEDVER